MIHYFGCCQQNQSCAFTLSLPLSLLRSRFPFFFIYVTFALSLVLARRQLLSARTHIHTQIHRPTPFIYRVTTRKQYRVEIQTANYLDTLEYRPINHSYMGGWVVGWLKREGSSLSCFTHFTPPFASPIVDGTWITRALYIVVYSAVKGWYSRLPTSVSYVNVCNSIALQSARLR